MNFHGVRYPMAGIGYVASYPEYRGEGGISAIMKEMLADLAKQKVALSYLAPFSYPFYRQYGYEQTFEQAEYTIKTEDWPRVKRVPVPLNEFLGLTVKRSLKTYTLKIKERTLVV